MRLRGVLGIGLGVSLLALSVCARDAHAVGFASSANARPIEERVMLSRSPERSVLVTQLRFDSRGEDVLIVVPVTDGSALDWSSRAFFEALEVATAPRVLGPVDNDTCPDHDEPAFDMTGDEEGLETLEPAEVTLLDDVAAVQAFATDRGVVVSPALVTALGEQTNVRFFVARFSAPSGIAITKALRVVTPAPAVSVPLVLSEAGSDDLRVTAWAVGKGRAVVSGDAVSIDIGELALEAGPGTSNYEDLLFSALTPSAAAPNPLIYDMSSHESLRQDIALRENGPGVKSFIRGYFERAAAYAEAEGQPSNCIAQAAAVLDQSARVGTACPRSELGVVGGASACAVDIVDPGEVDPALLRCGAKVDDLALIMSDLEPEETWLTRVTMKIPAAASGASRNVSFADGKRLDPELVASSIDLSECTEGGDGGGSSSNGPSSSGVGASSGNVQPSSASGGTVDVPLYVYDGCSACADGSYELVDYIEADSADAPDAYYEGDDCAGDSSATYADDSCDGDSYNGDEIAWDGEGCDCSETSVDWDSEGCDCDSSGYSDTCSADGFGDGCDCGGESLCATAQRPSKRAKKPRRLNAFVYAALAVIVPLRRLSRRRSQPKKPSSCPTKR
jgi:hypothetical protein